MPDASSDPRSAREGFVPVDNARLYFRDIGHGQPILVLHGGPDFDHHYFLPDLDRLADAFRLIYYDQRGRGQSGQGVRPEDVTLESEIEDLERVREYFQLESAAVLGHSWGGLLALEYALRHPERVSHLILMNSAPASHADYLLFRRELALQHAPGEAEEMKALSTTDRYAQGDLEMDAERYRIHFRPTLRRPEQLEQVVKSLRVGMTPEGVVKARAIEDRLYARTWLLSDYDLLPRLAGLRIPALVIHGGHDLVPYECAAHIAQAIPGAPLLELADCGHFSYLECPDDVRKAIVDLLALR